MRKDLFRVIDGNEEEREMLWKGTKMIRQIETA
jgi:hypothetical protein